ncbi:hypothetical protein [Anaerostipes butyraticus]|uniref:hypothetical protein n=1 Tax=Anaerostipes butyraticus TaxID=645466 RepID=UPI0023A7F162|nr:hypothetical protein [Anaerostipes butyraticus]
MIKNESILVRILGKSASVIFFISLLCLGVSLCLEPICTSTVQNTVLNSTMSDYMTNAIVQENESSEHNTASDSAAESRSDASQNSGITERQIQKVEEIVQSSPEMRELVSRYLEQYAGYLENGQMDTLSDAEKKKLLESVNDEILDTIEKEQQTALSSADRQKYKDALEEKENEVLDTLDTMPAQMEKTMPDAAKALKTYGKAVSASTQTGLALAAAISGILVILCRRQGMRWMKSLGISALTDGILIAAAMPFAIGIMAVFLTNQFLGQTGNIDISICHQTGGIMAGAGFILMLVYLIYKKWKQK